MKTKIPPIPFAGLNVVLGPLDLAADNWRWNRPIPGCFNLWVALEGQAEMRTRGKVHEVHPGTAFVFSPHQELAGRSVIPQRFRNFCCRFLPAGGGADSLRKKSDQLMGVQTSDLARIKMLCRAAVQTSLLNDALARQQAAGLSFQILAQVWRDAHSPAVRDPDTAILRLMDRLREQPSQRWTLEDMAEETGLSVSQFSRRFSALSGESPMRFAIRQRVLRAQQLLRGSSLHIGEIADTLGYEDVYFFSRQFKQVAKMSPSAYRETNVH